MKSRVGKRLTTGFVAVVPAAWFLCSSRFQGYGWFPWESGKLRLLAGRKFWWTGRSPQIGVKLPQNRRK
jgi:CubicO group peptidase (beta-lactamase class C family)